jgi:hypothetical protein
VVAAGEAARGRRAHVRLVEARAGRPSAPWSRRPGGGSPRSACASPGSCTTCSATTWR